MRKLAIFSCAFALAVALYVWLLSPLAVLIIGAALVFAALLQWLFRLPQQRRVRIAVCGLLFGFLWSWSYQQRNILPMLSLCGKGQKIQTVVTDLPQMNNRGCRVEVSCAGGTVLLYLNEENSTLELGDRVTVTANVLASTETTGEDNLYLQAKGITLVAFQCGEATVQKAEKTPLRLLPKAAGIALREKITALFPTQVEGFIRGLLTGDKSGLTYQTRNELSIIGVSHLLTVSGMHVSLLVAMVRLFFKRKRRLMACISIVVMVFFAAMLGFTPSVLRAVLMNSMLLLAPIFRRESDDATTLSFALMVVLLPNPWAIANISTQLSFGAMVGIYLFTDPMRRYMYRRMETMKLYQKSRVAEKLLRMAAVSLSMTLGAMALTVPLSASYFGTVSIISPIANMLLMIPMNTLFTCSMATVLLGFLYFPVGELLAWLLQWPIRAILWVASQLSKVPYAAVFADTPYIYIWLIAVYVLLAAFLLTRQKKPLRLVTLCAGLLVLALLLCRIDSTDTGVTVFDVGQGQSVLLQCGQVRVLVDCGGDSGETNGEEVARELLMRGEITLDAVVLTHYDTDHVCGLEQLFSRVEVERLFVPDIFDDSGNREWVVSVAEEADVPIYFIQKDTFLNFPEGTFALYPPTASSEDNQGLVVLMSADEYDVLVLGDMDQAGELHLLSTYTLPKLEVLVAGHHGSKNSTSVQLLDRLKPQVVLISVGRNSYGHPAQEVLDRIVRIDAYIFRTDLDGNITVSK